LMMMKIKTQKLKFETKTTKSQSKVCIFTISITYS